MSQFFWYILYNKQLVDSVFVMHEIIDIKNTYFDFDNSIYHKNPAQPIINNYSPK